MKLSKNIKIAILDFTVETNRGDAALQIGLLNLMRKYFDHSQISIVSIVGSNQFEYLADAHDHSSKWPVTLLGGLKPTFYPLSKTKRHILIIEILNALSVLVNLFPLMLAFAGLPVRVLSALYPSEFKKTLYAIHDADLVLWNRRNLRSRRFQPLEIYRTLNLLFHPLLAIAFGKPMAIAGSSLWELNSPVSRRIVQFTLEHFFFVSFREENSYREGSGLLSRMNPERIRLLPDLSFAAFDEVDNLLLNRKPLSPLEFPQRIGVTLVDWQGDGLEARERYIETIVGTIRSFAKHGARFVIVPQVTKKWEGYGKILNEIQGRLNPHEVAELEIVDGEPTVDELLNIYSQLDFLIATRMHSAIFALAVQTPVAAVSYDSGGKWGILGDLGYLEHIIPYAEVTAQKLIEKMSEVWKDRDTILAVVRQKVDEQIREVDLNISLLAEYFYNDFWVRK